MNVVSSDFHRHQARLYVLIVTFGAAAIGLIAYGICGLTSDTCPSLRQGQSTYAPWIDHPRHPS